MSVFVETAGSHDPTKRLQPLYYRHMFPLVPRYRFNDNFRLSRERHRTSQSIVQQIVHRKRLPRKISPVSSHRDRISFHANSSPLETTHRLLLFVLLGLLFRFRRGNVLAGSSRRIALRSIRNRRFLQLISRRCNSFRDIPGSEADTESTPQLAALPQANDEPSTA